MLKKIAFLSVNPLENFLPPTLQGCIKDHYQWMRSEALLREENLYCQEKIEPYGETGIPYQTLINLYLDDCAARKKELDINWR